VYTVEIDPVVVEVARRFFGIVPHERHRIIVKDGRDYLRGLPPAVPYDVIFLDAHRVSGSRAIFAPVSSTPSAAGA
jgi:spermidine synthase